MTDAALHPALQKIALLQRRRLRLLSLLLFLAVACGLMVQMMIAFTSEQAAGNLLLLGLVGVLMLPIVASLGGAMWYLDRQLNKVLATANQLLRECAPQAMSLNPIEKAGRDGALAALEAVGGQAMGVTEAVAMLINPEVRWSAAPQARIEISLYCQALQPGQAAVALGQGGLTLMGKLVEPAAYKRQQQWARIAVVLLTVIAAVVALAAITGRSVAP